MKNDALSTPHEMIGGCKYKIVPKYGKPYNVKVVKKNRNDIEMVYIGTTFKFNEYFYHLVNKKIWKIS